MCKQCCILARNHPLKTCLAWRDIIYIDFPLDLTRFFQGKHLIQFLANTMQDFQKRRFIHKCIFIFDAAQVYIKPLVTKFKNKEITAKP